MLDQGGPSQPVKLTDENKRLGLEALHNNLSEVVGDDLRTAGWLKVGKGWIIPRDKLEAIINGLGQDPKLVDLVAPEGSEGMAYFPDGASVHKKNKKDVEDLLYLARISQMANAFRWDLDLQKRHEFLEKLKTEMGEVQWQQMGHSERLRYVSAAFHCEHKDKITNHKHFIRNLKTASAFHMASMVVHPSARDGQGARLEFATANLGPSAHDRAAHDISFGETPANLHEQIIFQLDSNGTGYERVIRHASLAPIDFLKEKKVVKHRELFLAGKETAQEAEAYFQALEMTKAQMKAVREKTGDPWVYALLTSNFHIKIGGIKLLTRKEQDAQKHAALMMRDAMWANVTHNHPSPSILFNVGINPFTRVSDGALTTATNRTAMIEMLSLLRAKCSTELKMLVDTPNTEEYKAACNIRKQLLKALSDAEEPKEKQEYKVQELVTDGGTTVREASLTFPELIAEIERQEKIMIGQEKVCWQAKKAEVKQAIKAAKKDGEDVDVLKLMDMYYSNKHLSNGFKFNVLLHRVTNKCEGKYSVSCKSGNDRTKKVVRAIMGFVKPVLGFAAKVKSLVSSKPQSVTCSELCTLFDTGDFDKKTPGHGSEAGHKIKSKFLQCRQWARIKKQNQDIVTPLLKDALSEQFRPGPEEVSNKSIHRLWGSKLK